MQYKTATTTTRTTWLHDSIDISKLRRRLAVRRYNGVGDHVDDLFYSSFPIYDTADTATFAVAVNVEKKLQSLYTKTSRKNIAKFQIYQLNLAKYGYIRTFVSPNGGYTYMY